MVVYYYYAHAVPLQPYNIIRPTAMRWVVGTEGETGGRERRVSERRKSNGRTGEWWCRRVVVVVVVRSAYIIYIGERRAGGDG